MRQISFYRPKEKLRGIKRRLKSIDKWAESFIGYFPTEYAKDKYWNEKIPVLDRLLNMPTTNPYLQTYCANAILSAARYIEDAKPKNMKYSVVSVLLTYPDMFGSEICVFFDKNYLDNFFVRNSDEQKLASLSGNRSLVKELSLEMPEPFEERGYSFTTKDEWDGEIHISEEEWWSYCPKLND